MTPPQSRSVVTEPYPERFPSVSRGMWSNWAGNQRCRPDGGVVKVTTEQELVAVVRRAAEAGLVVRAAGTGHSFTDCVVTDGVLLDLSAYNRILDVDREACTVTVEAGATLRSISERLWTRGLAFQNLGDIDVQTVAGATSTGTHGTGLAFGNLSSTIVGMRIVTGAGEVVSCSATEQPEVFEAARVAIGALGMVSTITLRVVPAFHLHAVEEPLRMDEVRATFLERVRGQDHFEFFWVPHTGWALTKTNTRTLEPGRPRSRRDAFLQDELATNLGFGLVNRIGRRSPALIPRLARLLPSFGRVEYTDRSYRVFATPRRVRFLEMEYAVPLEATMEALDRVRALVDALGFPVSFPVEVRAVRGDDIPLSPVQGRDSGYIACHMYAGMPHERYFHGVERIMSDYGGRPHWGKLHFLDAEEMAARYPLMDRFQAVRRRMDPEGAFANAYVRRVLG